MGKVDDDGAVGFEVLEGRWPSSSTARNGQTRPALRTGAFHDAIHTADAAEDREQLLEVLRSYQDVIVLDPSPEHHDDAAGARPDVGMS